MMQPIPSELSRYIDFSALLSKPHQKTYEAKPMELKALAKRLGVLKIDFFRINADFTPRKILKNIDVHAVIEAIIWQECVVTLEPVKTSIKDNISLILSAHKYHDKESEAILYEGPEVITCAPTEKIDIGEIFVQYLCLSIDNFPRLPGI